jgi:hypothetical protein
MRYLPTPKDIYVSDDGVHLIAAFLNWEIVNASDRGNALEFYANGRILAMYNEEDLLVGYLGRAILSRFAGMDWPTCTVATFNDRARTFEVATNWGDAFRFDVASGNIIDSTLPWPARAAMLFGVALFASLLWWICRRFDRRAPPLARG